MNDSTTEMTTLGDVTFRKASPGDAAILAEARYAFRAEISQLAEERDAFIRRCTEWMRENLDNERWHCWVAMDGNRVIGNVWLEVVEKMPNPADEPELNVYVTNVFVDESARGRRIGEKLLAAATDWCRAESVHSMFLWPTARSVPFYERNGFEFGRMLEKNLSGVRSSV